MRFQQKTISGLFDGEKNFTIPVYQRAYSWEEKQWRDFYLDLKEQTMCVNYIKCKFLKSDDCAFYCK